VIVRRDFLANLQANCRRTPHIQNCSLYRPRWTLTHSAPLYPTRHNVTPSTTRSIPIPVTNCGFAPPSLLCDPQNLTARSIIQQHRLVTSVSSGRVADGTGTCETVCPLKPEAQAKPIPTIPFKTCPRGWIPDDPMSANPGVALCCKNKPRFLRQAHFKTLIGTVLDCRVQTTLAQHSE